MKELLFAGAILLLLIFFCRRKKMMDAAAKPAGTPATGVSTTPAIPSGSQQLQDNTGATANTTIIIDGSSDGSNYYDADFVDYVNTQGSIPLT
jgi:hypothetical protein